MHNYYICKANSASVAVLVALSVFFKRTRLFAAWHKNKRETNYFKILMI